MLLLFKCEMRQLLRSRWLAVTLLLTVFFTGISVYYVFRNSKERERWESPQSSKRHIEIRIQGYEETLKDEDLDPKLREEIEQSMKDAREQLETLEGKMGESSESWKKSLQKEALQLEGAIEEQYRKQGSNVDIQQVKRLITIKYLMDRELKEEEAYELNAFKTLVDVMEVMGPILIPLVVALLAIGIASYNYNISGDEMLLMAKTSHWKVLTAKCLTAITSISMLILFIGFVVFTLSGVFFGWKGGSYPVSVNYGSLPAGITGGITEEAARTIAEEGIGLVQRWQFIISVVLMNIFTSLVIAALAFATASLIRYRMLSLCVCMAGILGSYTIARASRFGEIMAFNFMNYMNPVAILTHHTYQGYITGRSVPVLSIGMLGFWGALALIFSFITFRKQVNTEYGIEIKGISLNSAARSFFGVRGKIIATIALSVALALLTTFLMAAGAFIMSRIKVFTGIIYRLYNTIGIIPIVVMTAGFLFLVYFFLLTQRSIRYIEEISTALNQVANGNFDTRIPVRSTDELGSLAENINRMAAQIKKSIDEERNAERMKNELITSVSHDLRTPLTSILGYLGLITNDRYKDEVELRYFIDIAYSKSQRLKKLIEDLFEFTRISHSGLKINPSTINLAELLEQLAEEFVPILQEAGMGYRLSVPKEKVLIFADGDMIVRVFENLISNAIRYGKAGKHVDIELSNDNSQAIVKVINYGEPIPESELPYIFEKFYRLEKSRSENTGGTGLGLAIAKNIVELHEGRISAYSQNSCTVFEVRLKIR